MPDTFKDFLAKWTQPAMVVTLLTAIVYSTIWLVKLDDRILAQESIIAVMRIESETTKEKLRAIELLLSRSMAVQDSQINQVRGLDSRMTRNESWISRNSNHKHSGAK